MENFIDNTLDTIFGGAESILLGANIILSMILIGIGLLLFKNHKKSSIGSSFIIFGLGLVIFNLIRVVL